MNKKKKIRSLKLRLWVTQSILILATITGVFIWFWGSEFRPVMRDAVIALGAHTLAGKKISVEPDYYGGAGVNPYITWEMPSNSVWLVRRTTNIVPFMSYEGLVDNAVYPTEVFFIPFTDDGSFHIAGRAIIQYGYVLLNERLITDDKWTDERDLLEVLTHELIHIQGGNFATWSGGETWEDQSAHLESATSAATVEVLAAMCNYGDRVACKAFWLDIESMARYSLSYRLRKLPGVYEAFANIFLRDADQEQASRKSLRFWMVEGEDVRMGIILKYGVDPWETHILRALKDGIQMDTGNIDGFGHRLSLRFDDTFDLLGPAWVLWIQAMTP